jgi:hypothetical protein
VTAERLPLESLTLCFQGLIPATLYTCSGDGIPNAALLSHVEYVDARHVALSWQFFNKSRKNIAENPRAYLRVTDPESMRNYGLRIRFERSETTGPLFEGMSRRIEAIASYSGLKGTFKLLAADVYEVLDIEESPGECAAGFGASPPAALGPIVQDQDALSALGSLRCFSVAIAQAEGLDALLDSTLLTLETRLGFQHSMILLYDRERGCLVTVASRGYPKTGVGSEVRFGEGVIGIAAEARQPTRVSGLMAGLLYAAAVKRRALEVVGPASVSPEIPLPGLADAESQLAIPLVARRELVGVLAVESRKPLEFHEKDRVFFEVLGSLLALALEDSMLGDRQEEADDRAGEDERPPAAAAPPPARVAQFVYFRSDECVFVDGEYLIRSLPARILWKLLEAHRDEARTSFTNRELRMDKTLGLPGYRDNLETRLILLRKRLEEKCPAVRLVPSGRGRFSLEVAGKVALTTRP